MVNVIASTKLPTNEAPLSFEVPEHVQAWAEKWEAMHAEYWRARSILLGWVDARGPIRLADGRLCGFQPSGHEWDGDAVAALFPALVRKAAVTFEGEQADIERVLSLVTEEFPLIEFEVKRTIDATAANAQIRAGGAAAEQLLLLRVNKSRLGVR